MTTETLAPEMPAEWAWLKDLCEPAGEYVTAAKIKPWLVGGRVVATNGQILVAVPGAFAPEPDETVAGQFARVLALPKMEPGPVNWQAIRDFIGPDVTAPPCSTCQGTGYTSECAECDGTGSVPCTCDGCGDDHDADCDECDGKGDEKCPDCKGGYVAEPVVMDGAVFDRKLLMRVVPRLDAAEVRFAQDGPERPAFFIADGWTLLAMALRHDIRGELPRLNIRRLEGGTE